MASLLKMFKAGSFAGAQSLAQTARRPARSLATVTRASAVGKKDLVDKVVAATAVPKATAEVMVNTVLETIVESVSSGKKVTVPGFGTFEPRTRAARKGRNPATGAEINIPETVAPVFSAGKTFKERVKTAKP